MNARHQAAAARMRRRAASLKAKSRELAGSATSTLKIIQAIGVGLLWMLCPLSAAWLSILANDD